MLFPIKSVSTQYKISPILFNHLLLSILPPINYSCLAANGLLFGTSMLASSVHPTNQPQTMKAFIEANFKMVDLNGDGIISGEEFRYNCITRIAVDDIKVVDEAFNRLLNVSILVDRVRPCPDDPFPIHSGD